MTARQDREDELAQLVRDARTFLAFHRDLGLKTYPFPQPWMGEKGKASAPIGHGQVQAIGPVGEAAVGTAADRAEALRTLALEAESCGRCDLASRRRFCVFGEGPADAEVLLVFEQPDGDSSPIQVIGGEERELLAKMLAAINLTLGRVYLTSLVKCASAAPPKPDAEELAACMIFLNRQIEAFRPAIILALGEKPAQCLLRSTRALFQLRGKVHRHNGPPVLVSYHPKELLEESSLKRLAWQDLQLLQKELQRLRR